MGLGLAISKKIVEQLGGRIAYKTKVGEGTTFTIELPVVQGD
jgi:signal transduction histidine kinase